jgi:hypothetical protein
LEVADDARPGRSIETATEVTWQQVEELTWAARRVTIDSVTIALRCSHSLAYSIMHDHLKFWKVCIWWVPRVLKHQEKMKWSEWVYPCNISYGMQMKEKICLTRLLLGMNHGHITTKLNKSVLHWNGNIPVHLQLKSLRLCHQLGRSRLLYFRILREHCQPVFRSVVKMWILQILWSSVEASGCSSQKTSRPTGKRVTASS